VDVVLATVCIHVSRVRATLLYAVVLAAVAEVLLMLGPHEQAQVIREASTNLHNLGEGRIETLIGSAFVNVDGPIYLWLPGFMAMLALGELLWQSRRMLAAFVIGHLGATLIVAAGLAAALAGGVLSMSVADSADVGMSYGAVGVLGTYTAALPSRWRPAWAGWWLAVAAGSVALSGGDFTNVGHGIALVIGMVGGSRLGRPAPWTGARWALLGVAVAFGYVVVGYNEMSIPATAAFGVLGALGAGIAWPRLRSSFGPPLIGLLWRGAPIRSSGQASG
jgi:hypothetical protein